MYSMQIKFKADRRTYVITDSRGTQYATYNEFTERLVINADAPPLVIPHILWMLRTVERMGKPIFVVGPPQSCTTAAEDVKCFSDLHKLFKEYPVAFKRHPDWESESDGTIFYEPVMELWTMPYAISEPQT